eukprot:NODE_561_length_1963_cov_5.774817_g450_i0.p13 GENE.NODE_561_length_1963_cov_5.774817_g450_i0~~NODE_561_length_1963_cov_5.774817_g450_i0.p13  ORF type:complete len:53 (+),score=3.18 NODE_561_length_1963_cov_5.774817_g450_i0:1330-1488(+)
MSELGSLSQEAEYTWDSRAPAPPMSVVSHWHHYSGNPWKLMSGTIEAQQTFL